MDTMYYKVVGAILLLPWSILALTVAGHLRARWARKDMTRLAYSS